MGEHRRRNRCEYWWRGSKDDADRDCRESSLVHNDMHRRRFAGPLSASLSRGCCKTPIIQIRSVGPVILRRKGLDGVDLSCRLDRQPSKARSVSVAHESLDWVDQCCRRLKAQSKTRDSRGPARARWNSMLLKSEPVGTSDAVSVPRSKHWPEPTTGDR